MESMTLINELQYMSLWRSLDTEGCLPPLVHHLKGIRVGIKLNVVREKTDCYATVLFNSLITKDGFNLVQGFVLVRIETYKNIDKCHHESGYRTCNLHRQGFGKRSHRLLPFDIFPQIGHESCFHGNFTLSYDL